MPNKLNDMSSKSSSQPSNKNTTSTSSKSRKSAGRRNVVTTNVPSKTVSSKNSKDSKSLSSVESGLKKSGIVKPKKTTKSDICCSQNVITNRNSFDYCKKCGDVLPSTTATASEDINDIIIEQGKRNYTETLLHNNAENSSKHSTKIKGNTSRDEMFRVPRINNKINPIKIPPKRPDSNPKKIVINREPTRCLQQYYKNENFQQTTDSAYEILNDVKRISLLETIKEIPEATTLIDHDTSSLDSTFLGIINHTDKDRNLGSDEHIELQKVKTFRDDNYFDCHNTQSRLKTKGSVTSLENHQCTYRFYLNERLFPEPLNMDHKQNIRCVECHLPLELSENSLTSKRSINGTIQAKVKIGSDEESQDTLLMLPVNDSLIIREKRKVRQREAEKPDIVYFGIIKLDAYGNSVFNKTLPENSLALRYQKGYKKIESSSDELSFQRMEKCDIVYV